MRSIFILILLFFVLFTTSFSQTYDYYSKPKFYGGLSLGYYGGFAIQGNTTISHLVREIPLSIRLGIGYTSTDPGNPAAARKIFINDATNGVPEKSGEIWDFRADFLIPVKLFANSSVFAGVRYSMFTGDFRFIDGNEFFTISSSDFGLGGGLETQFSLSQNLFLLFSVGADYYFSTQLYGHDTSYSTNGEDVNPRNNYTFDDADNAINQPKLQPRIMIGVNYGF